MRESERKSQRGQQPEAERVLLLFATSEGVRTKEWKYFRYVNDKSIEELYNLKKDPKEINNLIGKKKYRKVAHKLRLKLDELIKKNSNAYRAAPTDLTVELIREPSTDVKIFDLNT